MNISVACWCIRRCFRCHLSITEHHLLLFKPDAKSSKIKSFGAIRVLVNKVCKLHDQQKTCCSLTVGAQKNGGFQWFSHVLSSQRLWLPISQTVFMMSRHVCLMHPLGFLVHLGSGCLSPKKGANVVMSMVTFSVVFRLQMLLGV